MSLDPEPLQSNSNLCNPFPLRSIWILYWQVVCYFQDFQPKFGSHFFLSPSKLLIQAMRIWTGWISYWYVHLKLSVLKQQEILWPTQRLSPSQGRPISVEFINCTWKINYKHDISNHSSVSTVTSLQTGQPGDEGCSVQTCYVTHPAFRPIRTGGSFTWDA